MAPDSNWSNQQPPTTSQQHKLWKNFIKSSYLRYTLPTGFNLLLSRLFPSLLASLFQELKRGAFHQSTNWIDLPEIYMDPLPSPPVPTVSAQVPRGGSSTIATQATTRTGVPTITQDTSRATVTRVDNPTNDTEFTGITFRPGGARAVLRTHRPPANDAGHKFSVAWWTRGGCFPNCGHSATHRPENALACWSSCGSTYSPRHGPDGVARVVYPARPG
jgi:hypothetical protein